MSTGLSMQFSHMFAVQCPILLEIQLPNFCTKSVNQLKLNRIRTYPIYAQIVVVNQLVLNRFRPNSPALNGQTVRYMCQ